jgi:hypothetical protein
MTKMSLFDWDTKVRPHLHYIQTGAELCARHALQLTCKPDFAALACHELILCRAVLEAALRDVTGALAEYDRKPAEGMEHVA